MAKFDVRKEIAIRIETDGEAKGLVRTFGLAKHGLPELEIRNVPLFMGPDATRLLNKIANYMLNDPPKPIELGDTMAIGSDAATVKFEKLGTEERWTLTDAALVS